MIIKNIVILFNLIHINVFKINERFIQPFNVYFILVNSDGERLIE